MKKKIDLIWAIGIAFFFVAMFGIILWCGKEKILQVDRENSAILETIDDVYTNFIVGKYSLAYIDSKLSYYGRSGKNVNATRTLMGKDDWLFLKDNLDAYLGNVTYSEEEISNMIEQYAGLKARFENYGCEFVLFIAPNKMSIYDNQMSDYYVKKTSDFDTKQLVERLQETTDITVIFPLEEMLSVRDKFQLFYKYDTHWNPLGAYVGVQTILERLNEETVALSQEMIEVVEFVEHDSAKDDLADMIGMSEYLVEECDFGIKGSYQMDHIENYVEGIYVNDVAPNNEKVLFIGDSFRCDMVPYLVDNYREVYQIHLDNFEETLVETYMPDIVIYEVVEREFMSIGKSEE